MNTKFENLILEIFNKLAGTLKNYGIKLDLDSAVISKNIKCSGLYIGIRKE
jgi:hypothetical protein